MVRIKTPWAIGLSTLLFCSLPAISHRADAAPFVIQHDFSYAHVTLPNTPGQSTEIEWGLVDQPMSLRINDDLLDVVSIDGEAHIGPLNSLDADWNPNGTIGDAEYLFGAGTFELELVVSLLDGTLHTMRIRGATSPMQVNVHDNDGLPTGDFSMSVPHAKVDRASAALFGIRRQISGDMPYFTDVNNLPDNERDVALFGRIEFESEPLHHQVQPLDAAPVPEPALVGLMGLGLAAAVRRRL